MVLEFLLIVSVFAVVFLLVKVSQNKLPDSSPVKNIFGVEVEPKSVDLRDYKFPIEVIERFKKDFKINNHQLAVEAFEALREYFMVIQFSKQRVEMISTVADDAWHTFMMFTKEYMIFCISTFGHYLHHAPTDTSSEAKKEENTKRTQKSVNLIFNYVNSHNTKEKTVNFNRTSYKLVSKRRNGRIKNFKEKIRQRQEKRLKMYNRAPVIPKLFTVDGQFGKKSFSNVDQNQSNHYYSSVSGNYPAVVLTDSMDTLWFWLMFNNINSTPSIDSAQNYYLDSCIPRTDAHTHAVLNNCDSSLHNLPSEVELDKFDANVFSEYGVPQDTGNSVFNFEDNTSKCAVDTGANCSNDSGGSAPSCSNDSGNSCSASSCSSCGGGGGD